MNSSDYSKQNKCLDCNILISNKAKRCKVCANKGERNLLFGKKLTKNHRHNISKALKGRPKTHGETLIQHYCIVCKINKISYPTWLYGKKMCNACKNKKKLNPNYKGNFHQIKCNYCKKIYIISHWKFKNNTNCFCSRECRYGFQSDNMKGRKNPLFGKITHGKGAYYKNIWMRSSYEIRYAKYLDYIGVRWSYESKVFDLGNTTYTPDFYLLDYNTYIEVKGWWRPDAIKKFRKFRRIYPQIKTVVLNEKDIDTD